MQLPDANKQSGSVFGSICLGSNKMELIPTVLYCEFKPTLSDKLTVFIGPVSNGVGTCRRKTDSIKRSDFKSAFITRDLICNGQKLKIINKTPER